ncbi:MAG: hypothetical protein WC627_09465 [Legionella sp.]|jgi:hypothetical protein
MQLDYFLTVKYDDEEVVTRGLFLTLSEITPDKVEATITALSNFRLKTRLMLELYEAELFQVRCVFEALNKNSAFESIGISYRSSIVVTGNFVQDSVPIPLELATSIAAEFKKNTFIKNVEVFAPSFQDEIIADTFFSFLASNRISYIQLMDCSDVNAYKSLIKAVKLCQSPIKLEFIKDDSAPPITLSLDILKCFAINNGFNATLESLKFVGIDFENTDFIALLKFLRKYGNLIELSVVNAGLRAVMVPELVSLIEFNSNLAVIDINCNGIGNTGLRLLGDALKTNQTIRSINLIATGHPNSQDPEDEIVIGWEYLTQCLESNTTLTEIIVGNDDEGVEDFDCYSTIKVILMRNQVKNTATSIDENMSDKLNTLEHLNLKNTPIGGSWGMLAKMLGKMPALKTLSLSNNNIHDNPTVHLKNPDLEGVIYKLFPEMNMEDTVTTEQNPNKILKLN